MGCVEPYVAWKEMKIHEGQGYGRVELRENKNDRCNTSDGVMQAQEEGDGKVAAEQIDKGEVHCLLLCTKWPLN